MREGVIKIKADGTVRFINTPELATLAPNATVRRASQVEPDVAVYRWVFHSLRCLFGERGLVADWTRDWRILWRVNLAPVGGPVLPQRWWVRCDAIIAEVDWLNENFI
jgi:hypothetical protein